MESGITKIVLKRDENINNDLDLTVRNKLHISIYFGHNKISGDEAEIYNPNGKIMTILIDSTDEIKEKIQNFINKEIVPLLNTFD